MDLKSICAFFFLLIILSCNKGKNDDTSVEDETTKTDKQDDYFKVPLDFSGKEPLANPRKLAELNKNEDGYYSELSFKEDKEASVENWIIISDRDNNPTYLQPNGKKKFNTINFKDKFYVAQQNDDWIRIVKSKKVIFVGETFDETAEDFGWIHKDKVLRWKKSLKNKITGINIKTLTINTEKRIKVEDFKDIENVKFYQNPDLTETNGEITPLYTIFYLYKKEGDAYLIGKDYNINTRSDYKEILGWVNKDRFIIWDSRIAIEPNWRNNDNPYYSNPKVFMSRSMAEDYNQLREGGRMTNEKIIEGFEKLKERLPGNRFRFPVFETTSGIIHTGVVGGIYNMNNEEVSPGQYGNELNKVIEDLRKINVLFVIDFTKSMESYIPKVSEAINSTIKDLKVKYEKNNIRFSAFGYRDVIYGGDRSQILQRPSFKLDGNKSNEKDIEAFLRSVKTYNTLGHSEQLFQGVNEALEWNEIKNLKNNTNIVVVIGDAGNRPENYSYLIDKFSDNNCHLAAFQVQHLNVNENDSNPYDNFIIQLKNIILKASEKKAQIINEKYNTNFLPNFIENANTLKLKNSPLQTIIIKSKRGDSMSPERLKIFLIDIIEDCNRMADDLANVLTGSINKDLGELKNDDKPFGASMSSQVYRLLESHGVSKQTLDILKQKKYQFVVPGYAAYQPSECDSPVFNYTLYLTVNEIEQIVGDLKSMIRRTRNKRQSIVEAFKLLLKAKIGEDVAAKYKNPRDITNIIFGLPSQRSIFNEITNIEELLVEDIISDEKIENYWVEIEKCINTLDRITSKRISCPSLKIAGETYYWIPQEYLP